MKRKLAQLLALSTLMVASIVVTTQARAQAAIYSTVVDTDRVTSPATQNQYFTDTGAGFGMYLDVYQIGHVSTGVDFRGSYSANDKLGLGGVRAEWLTQRELVRPYTEFLVGGGTTSNVNGNPVHHLFYEVVGGVDCPMGVVDVRLLEFGIGKTALNNGPGNVYSGGNLYEVTISSGLVYRF